MDFEQAGTTMCAGLNASELLALYRLEATDLARVRNYGQIVLPRVGTWNVRQETEASLEARLTEALGEDLRDPTVDVIVMRRIQILGAVGRPGSPFR